MGINNLLGKDGMFICEGCRTKLKINIDGDTFDRLKKEVHNYENTKKTQVCYICNSEKYESEGLVLSNEWIANALDEIIKKSEEVYDLFTKGFVICPKCGNKFKYHQNVVVCPKCNAVINMKKYKKETKLSVSKKVTFKLYIKLLRNKK